MNKILGNDWLSGIGWLHAYQSGKWFQSSELFVFWWNPGFGEDDDVLYQSELGWVVRYAGVLKI